MNADNAIGLLRKFIRLKHLSYSTEDSYVYWLVQFCRFASTVKESLTSEQKIEKFLTSLALKDVSASTQNQAFNAILFFYRNCLKIKLGDINALRAKRGERIRNAYPLEDIRRLINEVKDSNGYPIKLVVQLLFGCGLRLCEPLNLRIRDIDLKENKFIIRQAKGNKDGIMGIPEILIDKIKGQIELAEKTWKSDVYNKIPIKLPNRIAQKYPAAQFSRHWAWLFPMNAPCQDTRSEQIVRYRMLECNIQRAIKKAGAILDLDIKPHELRHSFCTHLLNKGVNPRSIQLAMRHSSLETTMKYLHSDILKIPSPLDRSFV